MTTHRQERTEVSELDMLFCYTTGYEPPTKQTTRDLPVAENIQIYFEGVESKIKVHLDGSGAMNQGGGGSLCVDVRGEGKIKKKTKMVQ